MKFGEWILISEQLPPEPKEYGDNYITTVNNNQVVVMKYKKTTIRGEEILRWEYMGRISNWNVIAWMPMPEPYISMNK